MSLLCHHSWLARRDVFKHSKMPLSTLPLYLWSLGLASDHNTTKEISTFGHKSQSGRNANRKWAIITFHNYNNGEQASKIHSFDCQLILVICHDLRKKTSSCLWRCWFRHLWNMMKVGGCEYKVSFGVLSVGEWNLMFWRFLKFFYWK